MKTTKAINKVGCSATSAAATGLSGAYLNAGTRHAPFSAKALGRQFCCTNHANCCVYALLGLVYMGIGF